MKICIFGGCGFIGSNVSRAFLESGHRVLLYDDLSRQGVVKNLMWLISSLKKIKFFQYDIRDYERVKQAIHDYDIDVVFNFAAQTAVTTSLENPKEDFEINALGNLNVLEAIRTSEKKPHFIYASTNKVYGEFKTDKPTSEKQPLKFSTPYGCSKGAGDQYTTDYFKSYGLDTCVLRMSCIYGNRQFGTEDQGWLAHFMFQKERGEPITIYGDGSQVRDVLYIDDYVDLCKMIVKMRIGGVYNVGGGEGNQISVIQAARLIGNEYSFGDWRKGDQKYYVSDITKIKSLGWEPKTYLAMEGISKLKEWVKNPK
jgi:CDP-paratose 2-epimerase